MRRALFWLLIAASAGRAQGTRPVVGPMRPFSPPVITDERVNALRVSLIPFGTTPTARVELVFRSGRGTEQGNEVGLAQLTGDYLLEGTRARGTSAVSRELASIGTVGGGLTVSVGAYETVIAGEVLSESAPRLIEIIAEVALIPALDSAALGRLVGGVLRRNQLGSGAAIAAARTNQTLFPNHPADRPVSETALHRLTVDDVRRFHQREYVGARAQLYVAGVFDSPAVLARIRSAFEKMPAGTAAAPLPLPPASFRTTNTDTIPVIHLIDRPGATQTHVHIAYPVVDQTHPDHLVLNEVSLVMGSVQTSRIVANVRERHGSSYNIGTGLLRSPGATSWAIQGDVNRDATGATLREILSEMRRLGADPPSAQELGEYQRFLAGVLVSEMSTPRGILDKVRYLALYAAARDSSLRAMRPDVFRVTPTDVARVRSTYLRDDRRVIVLIGDTTALRPQLAGWTRILPLSP